MAEPRMRAADELRPVDQFPGVERRTLASGDRLTLVDIRIAAGHEVPEHAHPHEQAGTVVSGRMRIRIGDASSELDAGAAYLIPGDVPHHVVALDDVHLVEAFAPVREDFRD